MRTQYYKLKKNNAFRWNLLRHGIMWYICPTQTLVHVYCVHCRILLNKSTQMRRYIIRLYMIICLCYAVFLFSHNVFSMPNKNFIFTTTQHILMTSHTLLCSIVLNIGTWIAKIQFNMLQA